MNNVNLFVSSAETDYQSLNKNPNLLCFSEHAASTLEAGRVCVSPVNGGASGNAYVGVVPEERSRKSKEELRELWRKAILQQILLQRMERENQKLQGEWNT